MHPWLLAHRLQFTKIHTITQGDIDAGEVQNTATAAYTYAGENYTEEEEVTVRAIQGPGLSITKTADETSFGAVGDEINYTITVTNTGNVVLTRY